MKNGSIMFKRISLLLSAIILMSAVTGCYSESDITTAKADGFNAGYDAGYDDGKDRYDNSDGQPKLKDSVYDSMPYLYDYTKKKALNDYLTQEGVPKPKDEDEEKGYDDGYHDGFGSGYDSGYNAGYSVGYDDGYDTLKPVARPASGAILSGSEYDGSTLTVNATLSCDYVISLKDASGWEYLCFYVRSGDTVSVGVPQIPLYAYFASGDEWYGYGKGLMFGDDTSYSKDDEVLDFTEYSWEYTLYPVVGGNFTETPSNENEFF